MDIETRFIRAMAQAIDNHFLRGGPFPDDTAILAIAPELAGLLASPEELKNEEEGGMEWIPVTERLPEPGVRVLIFCPLADPNEVAAAVLRHDFLWMMDDGGVYGGTEPTHWMPLPTPPRHAARTAHVSLTPAACGRRPRGTAPARSRRSRRCPSACRPRRQTRTGPGRGTP